MVEISEDEATEDEAVEMDRDEDQFVISAMHGATLGRTVPCILQQTEVEVVVNEEDVSRGISAEDVLELAVEDQLGLQRYNPMHLHQDHSMSHRCNRQPLHSRETCRAQAGAPRKTAWAGSASPTGWRTEWSKNEENQTKIFSTWESGSSEDWAGYRRDFFYVYSFYFL